MKHDNLRDNIGQVIHDRLAEHWDRETQGVRLDIFDSHNIDVIADEVLKVVVEYDTALIEKVDFALDLVQQTFGNRLAPPKVLTAAITMKTVEVLREQLAQLKAAR